MKTLLSVFSIVLFSVTSFATGELPVRLNNAGSGKCFDENTKIINIGVGFGGSKYYKFKTSYGYYSRRTPAISMTYEQAYPKKLGIGYLGVGAYLGFQHASYGYDDLYYQGNRYYYEHRWNYFMVAARAAYHFDVLNSEKAEVYVGAIVGMRFQTYTYTSNHPDPYYNKYYRESGGSIFPTGSLFAGARWYFSKNVGLFGEVGYGISFVTGGFSIKF